MAQRGSSRGLTVAFFVTVFWSAFLLFQVQPLFGKFILPWFGGSPAVWTTCMLVFQVLLLAGYTYAHLMTQYLTLRQQGILHAALLFVALMTLPITPDPSWKPTNGDWPALKIILLTLASMGLPYFMLSSTGPLVQSWYCQTHEGQSPYRLYSLSNAGSLLALLSYPFVMEPLFANATQSSLWSCLFAGFAVLCSGCAVVMWRRVPDEGADRGAAPPLNAEQVRPTAALIWLWFGLAMIPSILLLATTNQVCLDTAVIPFLWVLPLALYLLTFILCFDSDRWYSRRPYGFAAAIFVLIAIYLGHQGPRIWLPLQIVGYFSAMFCCCMVCHGELVSLKPHPRSLTAFYLTISAGGAAGGLFVGLAAPLLFKAYYELDFGFIGFAVMYICVMLHKDAIRLPLPKWAQPALVPLILGMFIVVLSLRRQTGPDCIAVVRNFYGVLRVESRPNAQTDLSLLVLFHGGIEHGSQFVSPQKRGIPTTYYSESSGVGQLMQGLRPGQPKHVGVVGLGVGTLTAYGKTEDRFRVYEIDSDVVALARAHFWFLEDCPADVTIVTGDARLSLEFEAPQQFDVLVLDAFSGDAIPVHLLTREAIDIYLKHLKPDGVLAFHISNLSFDLHPILVGLSDQLGLSHVIRNSDWAPEHAGLPAQWAILARQPEILADSIGLEPNAVLTRKPIVWSDGRNNLFEVLRWSRPSLIPK